MKTISIEVALSNEDYEDGFEEACEAAHDAAREFLPWLNIELEDLGLKPLSKYMSKKLGVKVVGDPEFVEADSTRSHGSCYFDTKVELPDDLCARIEAARIERDVAEYTGD